MFTRPSNPSSKGESNPDSGSEVRISNNRRLNRGTPQKMYGTSDPQAVTPKVHAGSFAGYLNEGSVLTFAKASCVSLALFATAVISSNLPSRVKLLTIYKSISL